MSVAPRAASSLLARYAQPLVDDAALRGITRNAAAWSSSRLTRSGLATDRPR
ncbi:MAG: hypothetical protein LBD90_00260 [Bifidobacteriaceae bacterium]|nr:hypothetical protein [Bifidobacteriaceae bacterium]